MDRKDDDDQVASHLNGTIHGTTTTKGTKFTKRTRNDICRHTAGR